MQQQHSKQFTPAQIETIKPLNNMVLVERITDSVRSSGLIVPVVEGRDRMNLAKVIAVPANVTGFRSGDMVYVKVNLLVWLVYRNELSHIALIF